MAATALPAVMLGLASTSSAATGPRKAAVCRAGWQRSTAQRVSQPFQLTPVDRAF